MKKETSEYRFAAILVKGKMSSCINLFAARYDSFFLFVSSLIKHSDDCNAKSEF
jgi:hypothetical protein